MTINWFSPVPPTRSSIAMDTAAVLPALSRRAQIVVWTDQATWAQSLEEHAEVRRYDPFALPWEEINAADLSVYHLGNHTGYHAPIWQVSRNHPGLIVLHDVNLQHFFAGLADEGLLSRREYLQMMALDHPSDGERLGEAVLACRLSPDEVCGDCPLTAAAIESALGVAVHTENGRAAVAAFSDLPVAYVPLFAIPETSLEEPPLRKAKPEGVPYRIIIFGFLGSNRRLESVVTALHQFGGRDRFRLDVYGPIAREKSFLQLVRELDLRRFVTVHGFVSDARLIEALKRSDLAINLRNPTMGEASASQLRIWQQGLPSLVTDIGWYATLPKEIVAFVRPEAEDEDLRRHLSDFLEEPERYYELGRNGRRYVNEHHSQAAYVDGLMNLIGAAMESRPRLAVRSIAARAGQAMNPWFSEAAADILLPRLAEKISQLFDQPGAR